MKPDPVRILLLEDEEPIANVTSKHLERFGYSVTCVHDGLKGLEEAATGEYELCLLNVILPGLGGYSIAQELKARDIGLPLMFYTGTPEQEVLAEIRSRGIKAAYFEKPPSIRALVAKIAEVLDGRGWL